MTAGFGGISSDYWKKTEQFTLHDAAYLICGLEPPKSGEMSVIVDRIWKELKTYTDLNDTFGEAYLRQETHPLVETINKDLFLTFVNQYKMTDYFSESDRPESQRDHPSVNPTPDKPLTKSEKQISAILEAIRSKGLNPMEIPDGGKSSLRDECRRVRPDLFDSDSSFDNAWKKGSKESFMMANHYGYAKRGK